MSVDVMGVGAASWSVQLGGSGSVGVDQPPRLTSRNRIARYIAGQVRDAAIADGAVSSRPLVDVRAVTKPGAW